LKKNENETKTKRSRAWYLVFVEAQVAGVHACEGVLGLGEGKHGWSVGMVVVVGR
jgi:hypothetical protein